MRPQLRLVLLAASIAVAIVLALAIALGGFSKGTSGGSGSSSAGSRSEGGFDGAALPPGLRAHELTLSNQRGQSVSLSGYRGQVVVLAFLFSDCRACALVAQQVRGALDELKGVSGVRAVFVSTDPSTDTRARVARFLSEASLTGRVEYLTGTTARLRGVWRAYGIPPVSSGRAASEAGTTVLLIDRDGVERVDFGLEQLTPESLAHDIRVLRAG